MKMTIIIPTRNRAETLRYALATCTSQTYPDLEIIVSDNCSTDDTEAVVRAADDKRVRYLRTPSRLSMRANFEFALSHVHEGFVGFIGDDDGLMPNAIARAASFLGATGLLAVTSALSFYRWPSTPASIRNTGSVQYCPDGDKVRKSSRYVKLALSGNGAFYVHDLPSLYYGFAHVTLTRPTRGGNFFQSITPDAFSAFAIAAQVAEYGYLGEPLFVVGASNRSNGVSNFEAGADPAEAKAFQAENDIPFHANYIFCKSISMSLHEAFAQAAECYPVLAEGFRSRPLRLIYQLALETKGPEKRATLPLALAFGAKHNIQKAVIRFLFLEKVAILLRAFRLAERQLVLGNLVSWFQGRHVFVEKYTRLDEIGVRTVAQAAVLFAKELSRLSRSRLHRPHAVGASRR